MPKSNLPSAYMICRASGSNGKSFNPKLKNIHVHFDNAKIKQQFLKASHSWQKKTRCSDHIQSKTMISGIYHIYNTYSFKKIYIISLYSFATTPLHFATFSLHLHTTKITYNSLIINIATFRYIRYIKICFTRE